MNTVVHKADERGHSNLGWLDSYHSFSFSEYYNAEKMQFGALRVLNDDTIAGGTGFGTHPHQNMEIVSIPLTGSLRHADSMGNEHVIKPGDIQVMSAGTGVHHSEYNNEPEAETNFLQIWILPNKQNTEPRYDEIRFKETGGDWQLLISPDGKDGSAWIQQDAWFYLADIRAGEEMEYKMNQGGDGVYFFLLEGSATAGDVTLNRRDAAGFSETDSVSIKAGQDSRLLAIEVPMR